MYKVISTLDINIYKNEPPQYQVDGWGFKFVLAAASLTPASYYIFMELFSFEFLSLLIETNISFNLNFQFQIQNIFFLKSIFF